MNIDYLNEQLKEAGKGLEKIAAELEKKETPSMESIAGTPLSLSTYFRDLNKFSEASLRLASELSQDSSDTQKNKEVLEKIMDAQLDFMKKILNNDEEGKKLFGTIQAVMLEGKKSTEKMDDLPVV